MIKNIQLHLYFLCLFSIANATELQPIVISTPGPGSLTYLPVDLIPIIKADIQEGLKLRILHTTGGAVALHNLAMKNADFAVAGVPAVMSQRANGGDVVIIAAVSNSPLFALMVRASLKDTVQRIADLKGKTIGVNTSTKNSKTTSQQLGELLLKSDGVPINTVHIVPAGQSWITQSSLILSRQVDAIVGDEPFASRLLAKQQVFILVHSGQPETIKNIPGANFLHAALETRSDVIANEPDKVAKVVRMLQRSLAWIANHTSEQLVEVFKIKDQPEYAALLQALQKYPTAFSRDGKFISTQLKETNIFFHSGDETGANKWLNVEQMIDERWVGRRN